jgi:glycogen debranching enzyme
VRHFLNTFRYQHLQKYKLWEFAVLNVEQCVEELKLLSREGTQIALGHFIDMLQNQNVRQMSFDEQVEFLRKQVLCETEDGSRFSKKMDTKKAYQFIGFLFSKANYSNWEEHICLEYTKFLNTLNLQYYKTYDEDLDVAFKNLHNSLRFERLDEHGPRRGPISLEYNYCLWLMGWSLTSPL